jgi:hypothetical protein
MRARIKVTGYFDVEDYEVDRHNSTGLTAEAYGDYISGGSPLGLDDLDDLQTRLIEEA